MHFFSFLAYQYQKLTDESVHNLIYDVFILDYHGICVENILQCITFATHTNVSTVSILYFLFAYSFFGPFILDPVDFIIVFNR